jgi:hypothetical protein
MKRLFLVSALVKEHLKQIGVTEKQYHEDIKAVRQMADVLRHLERNRRWNA